MAVPNFMRQDVVATSYKVERDCALWGVLPLAFSQRLFGKCQHTNQLSFKRQG